MRPNLFWHRLRRLRTLPWEIARLQRAVAEMRRMLDLELPRITAMLQIACDDETGNQRRLFDLRSSAQYGLAFTEPEPLVSVIIPTHKAYETLRDRALPSVLAQTYQHFEIIVVGDGAPPETADVVAGFNDDRIVYENLPVRGPYPEDPMERWNVSGVFALNAALAIARGRWVSPFADDDALRPDALKTVLDNAKRHRHEVCYGVVNCILADGREVELGSFPPHHGRFAMQGGMYHSGLRFMAYQLSDGLFGVPNDWSLARRMLRIGVRFGFVEEVVADYFPTSNPLGFEPIPRGARSEEHPTQNEVSAA